VKIIKKGTLPPKKIIRHECMTCRTVFEFEPLEGIWFSDRDGEGVKIKCPVCREWIWINN
jgi:hypothetical protein